MGGELTDSLLIARDAAILKLILNRPEKRNSLNPVLVEALSSTLDEAASDETVNVLVITGAGRSFCAGLDLSLLASWSAQQKLDHLDKVVRIFGQLWALPQPVIAAVNGAAIAGGFDLAAFCDIRLASEDAVFGQAEINLGLTQIIHPLYKSIGLAHAKEMALTGKTITAAEAYRIGLVNHVYAANELERQTQELAALLAAKPRHALFETKRLTRELVDLDTRTALQEIRQSFVQCVESEDHKNRVAELYARVSGAQSKN